MAIIPAEEKVFMVSNSTNTTYSGSAALKAMQQWYTMEDVTNTVRPYQVFTALLTQSGGDSFIEITSGLLTIGVSYNITASSTGDDFRNVGGPLITTDDEFLGTYFVATGTTPTNYTNGTSLGYNTGAPVVNVLENTIGNVWFTYVDVGNYIIYSNGLFTENKTILFASSMNNGNDTNNHTATVYTNAPDELSFRSWGNTGDNYAELDNSIPLPIEIRVYN
jgi:hypothetical protein